MEVFGFDGVESPGSAATVNINHVKWYSYPSFELRGGEGNNTA
jgi:hypothetical protein